MYIFLYTKPLFIIPFCPGSDGGIERWVPENLPDLAAKRIIYR